jgi:hypothetical protein
MPETYSRMIKAIAENPQDLIAFGKIIRWLLFWGLPLSLCQLGVLAAIRPPEIYAPGEDYSPDDIVEICGSFIRVAHLGGQYESVQVAHFSVTEYFLTQTFSGGTFNPEFISREDGHGVLLASCLTYLSSFRYDWRQAQDSRTLYEIVPVDTFERDCTTGVHNVAGRWPRIARVVESDPESCQTIVSFLTTSSAFTSWLCYRRLCDYSTIPGWPLNKYYSRHDKPSDPLYYAARYGLPQVVNRLLRDATDVNPMGASPDFEFRASIGVESGSEPATFRLREAAFNAAEMAALRGDFEVMKLLTDGGGKFGKNLISRVMDSEVSFGRDNSDLMSSLLSLKKYVKDEHSLDIDDSSTQSLIYAAVAHGQYHTTKSLLNDVDVDVNSRLPETQDTLLHLASVSMRLGFSKSRTGLSIAELLIANGADIWAKGRFGWRPIEAAAFWDDWGTVGFLLGHMHPDVSVYKPKLAIELGVDFIPDIVYQTASLLYEQLCALEPEAPIWHEMMGNLILHKDRPTGIEHYHNSLRYCSSCDIKKIDDIVHPVSNSGAISY